MSQNFVIFLLLIILGAGATGGMWWYMNQKQVALEQRLGTATEDSARTIREMTEAHAAENAQASSTIADLTTNLETLTRNRDELEGALEEVQSEYTKLSKQVGSALKTVGVLDKLSKIDPELLLKYSKVFFLNEHYAPPKTIEIDKEFLYNESNPQYLHAQVTPFFNEMVKDALADGVYLYAESAYRSFDTQKTLKSTYAVTYGSGANAFSADQGYSEHQLGTTIDFTTKGLGGGLTGFETTPAYEWLTKNAYKYGFELSYPKGNTYYIYEPWHWRFVGTKLARMLHTEDKNFYDVDQREIDKYLVNIFD